MLRRALRTALASHARERRAAARRESWRRLRHRVERVEDAADMSLRRMIRVGSAGVRRAKGLKRSMSGPSSLRGGLRGSLRGGGMRSSSLPERRALRTAERDAQATVDADIETGAPAVDLRTRLLLLAAREKKEAAHAEAGGSGAGGAGAGDGRWGVLCSAPVVESMQREKQRGEAKQRSVVHFNPDPNPNPNPNPNLDPVAAATVAAAASTTTTATSDPAAATPAPLPGSGSAHAPHSALPEAVNFGDELVLSRSSPSSYVHLGAQTFDTVAIMVRRRGQVALWSGLAFG